MGFIWEYADFKFEKPFRYPIGKYPHKRQMKKVVLIDIDGTIKVFQSIKEAGLAFGHTGGTISRYINGSRCDQSGRLWKLE
jgi:hypothetical protein